MAQLFFIFPILLMICLCLRASFSHFDPTRFRTLYSFIFSFFYSVYPLFNIYSLCFQSHHLVKHHCHRTISSSSVDAARSMKSLHNTPSLVHSSQQTFGILMFHIIFRSLPVNRFFKKLFSILVFLNLCN